MTLGIGPYAIKISFDNEPHLTSQAEQLVMGEGLML